MLANEKLEKICRERSDYPPIATTERTSRHVLKRATPDMPIAPRKYRARHMHIIVNHGTVGCA